MSVRTRFAPSPTGFMHVGSARTALFAWLLARQNKGQFILRLEDTDKTREVAGSDQHIMDTLNWLGLDWDEGPDSKNGQYRQSKRLDIYHEWAQKLVDSGRAYADPFSSSELEKLRQGAIDQKKPFLFREHRPQSANWGKWKKGVPLRFASEPKTYAWHDEVMGDLSAGEEAVDDFILIKSDGYPTYNFAHIVDDHLMQISHVIRSQEFLASVPKFLNLYDALGIKWPVMATLPYVMGPDGKRKLSKRDGAKDILEYAKEGILPDAMINYLASLGWNDGTEQEVYSRQELINRFSLSRVQRSGARFDEQKLSWLNWQHYQRLIEAGQAHEIAQTAGWSQEVNEFLSDSANTARARLAATKASSPQEYLEQIGIFTQKPRLVDSSVLSKLDLDAPSASYQLDLAAEAIKDAKPFDKNTAEQALRGVLAKESLDPRVFLNLVRWSLSGRPVSPSLFELMEALGHEECLERIERASKDLV